MPFLEDVAEHLIAGGIATKVYRTSAASIPAGDGPIFSMRDTGGTAPTRVQSRKRGTNRPSLQVAVRGTDPAAVRTKANQALQYLDGIYNTTINGTFYQSITSRQTEPVDAGLDAEKRLLLTFNLDGESQSSS